MRGAKPTPNKATARRLTTMSEAILGLDRSISYRNLLLLSIDSGHKDSHSKLDLFSEPICLHPKWSPQFGSNIGFDPPAGRNYNIAWEV
jgi:hypothetical protein